MSKIQLRKHLRTHLAQAGEGLHAGSESLSHNLMVLLDRQKIKVLGGYFPLPGEPDIATCMENLHQRGVQCVYPQLRAAEMRYVVVPQEVAIRKDRYNCILGNDLTSHVPDVLLIPFLGYTRAGYRLGRGGGFIDRYLAKHPHVVSIGVGYACQEIQMMPEPHDVRLSYIVTESLILSFDPD